MSDREYLLRKSIHSGYLYASLAAPLLYSAFLAYRKIPWNLNRTLRATWIAGIAGMFAGGGIEYIKALNAPNNLLRTRRMNRIYDARSLRAEDHSTIGALIGATLTPAVFWKRARSVHLILGGAGIGAGIGLLVHWSRPFPQEELSTPASSSSI